MADVQHELRLDEDENEVWDAYEKALLCNACAIQKAGLTLWRMRNMSWDLSKLSLGGAARVRLTG